MHEEKTIEETLEDLVMKNLNGSYSCRRSLEGRVSPNFFYNAALTFWFGLAILSKDRIKGKIGC